MSTLIYQLIFIFITIFIFFKTVGYAIYELKEKQNKVGAVTIICFSFLIIVFSNIAIIISL